MARQVKFYLNGAYLLGFDGIQTSVCHFAKLGGDLHTMGSKYYIEEGTSVNMLFIMFHLRGFKNKFFCVCKGWG